MQTLREVETQFFSALLEFTVGTTTGVEDRVRAIVEYPSLNEELSGSSHPCETGARLTIVMKMGGTTRDHIIVTQTDHY